MTDLPRAVAAAAELAATQSGVPWPRSRWKQALPEYAYLLDGLPPALDRSTVRAACGSVEPREALVLTMVWGFAGTGYGPHRVQKMLATDDLHDRLASVLRVLYTRGPLEAYRLLGDGSRVVQLGPAFGTKFLFFHDESALILDALIGDWFYAATGEDLRVTQWRPESYERYLRQMAEWSAEVSLTSALLEERAFVLSSTGSGSQWDQVASSSPGAGGTRIADHHKREGTRGAKLPRDVVDRGLREVDTAVEMLRDWWLAHRAAVEYADQRNEQVGLAWFSDGKQRWVVFDDASEPVQAFPPFDGDLGEELSEHDRSKLHIYPPDVWSRQPFLRRLRRQPPSREMVAAEPQQRRIRGWPPGLLPRGKSE